MNFLFVIYLKPAGGWPNDLFTKLSMLLLCFSSFCFTARAQYEHKDALLYNDTIDIFNRFRETEENIQEGVIDIDSSISAYQSLLALSRKAKYQRAIIIALRRIGDAYGSKGEWSKAEAPLHEAIQLTGRDKGHQPGLAYLYENYATVQLQANKLDSAAFYFLKAAAVSHAEGNKLSEAVSYNNVSDVFRLLKMPQKSLDYLQKGLAISLAIDNDLSNKKDISNRPKQAELSASLYRNIGDKYLQMDDADSIKKGKSYLSKALDLSRQYNLPGVEEGVFTSLAVYYMNQKEYEKAIRHFEKAISIKTPSGGPNMGFQYAKLGECYFLIKDYKKAALQLKKAIQEADKYNVRKDVDDFYLMLARIYEAMGAYQKATQYYELHAATKDSIDRSQIENAVLTVQYQYETAQKDNEILNGRLKISSQQAVIDRNRIILMSLTVITLLTALSVWLYIRNRRRLQKQTEKQALEIAAWRASLEGEEKERRRLAKELHDNIGGNLSTLKMWLGNIRDDTSDLTDLEQDYTGALDLLDRTLMEVRNTAHHLMPELLLRLGLAEAIRVYCNDIQQASGIRVNYQYLGYIGALDNNMELLIYRTVQELVQNVVKHAKAGYLLVQLTQFDKTLSITIEDNGTGMETPVPAQHNGIGLASIKDSIEKLKGVFRVHSEKGGGTTIEIEINTENDVLNDPIAKYEK